MKRSVIIAALAITLALTAAGFAQQAPAPPPPSQEERMLQLEIENMQLRFTNLVNEIKRIEADMPKKQAELKKITDAKKPAPAPAKEEGKDKPKK